MKRPSGNIEWYPNSTDGRKNGGEKPMVVGGMDFAVDPAAIDYDGSRSTPRSDASGLPRFVVTQ
jgi:hypothetical protein